MKIIIEDNKRGLLFKNGKFSKMLYSGKYCILGDKKVDILPIDKYISKEVLNDTTVDILLKDKNILDNTTVFELRENELAFHFVNGKFIETLAIADKYIFWNDFGKHKFNTINIDNPLIPDTVQTNQLANDITIISEGQVGLLFRNGQFIKMLTPGRYYNFEDNYIKALLIEVPLTQGILNCEKYSYNFDIILQDNNIKSNTEIIEVLEDEIALYTVDGKKTIILFKGKYVLWSGFIKYKIEKINVSNPEVTGLIPDYLIQSDYYKNYFTTIYVSEYEKCRLYYNCKLKRILDSGVYYFFKNAVVVDHSIVDTRLTKMDIVGQEILTQDKISIRLSLVCNYRIKDFIKVLTEIDDYKEQIHLTAQLAMREYVGKYKIDELLDNKENISKYILERLQEKAKSLYIEIEEAGVKDIILPGEMRSIMNTVILAEKKAQANVITRREEVASTRSLLNTAKLMDENKTLYKLKELEYIERICENVGNININGNENILSQLLSIIGSNKSN